MNRISLPTSCLLDKNVVREALRGLVRETSGLNLPPRQATSLNAIRAIMAYAGLLYITPELLHILDRRDSRDIARPLRQHFHVLNPGKYLKRWRRRLMEEEFSREDALIVSYGSFGVDSIEKTFGVEVVLTNDLNMKNRYERGFSRIQERFQRMTSQLKSPYQLVTLPEIWRPEELLVQLPL